MNRQNQNTRFPVIGGSSLLIIFAVLCLTVFALLGLSTVHANKRLSDISIQAVSDYYAADTQAEQILAQLRTGEIPAGVSRECDVFTYTCPISDTQQLEVAVRSGDWEILCWRSVSSESWQADESLKLWDGN